MMNKKYFAISLVHIILLITSCSEDNEGKMESKIEVICTEQTTHDDWVRIGLLSGYEIFLPQDREFIISEFRNDRVGIQHHKLGMAFGFCDLNFVSDPPCAEYHKYHPRDSIPNMIPDSTILSERNPSYLIPLVFKLCKDDQIYGALYFDSFNTNRSIIFGKLYLRFENAEYLHYSGQVSLVEESAYTDAIDAISTLSM